MPILRYDPSMAQRWNEFVRFSANATFLHDRRYMDYHADRFTDCSLVALDAKGRVAALLPANASGTTLYSHQGLTYGGWLVARRHSGSPLMLGLWREALDTMRSLGFRQLVYKPVPYIFARYPSDDDLYALWRAGGRQTVCQLSSAIPLREPSVANETSRQLVRKVAQAGFTVSEDSDLEGFMTMLDRRLMEAHNTRPVHTLSEMRLLMERFPENIRLVTARDSAGTLAGGTIVYLCGRVVHTQYIATTEAGRRAGVMPAVIDYVARNLSAGADYLDFGTSCEDGGRVLNAGLIDQKYGMGGRPVAYTAFTLDL